MVEGNDVTIIANGLLVAQAILAAETLEAEGISARVIDMHTVKPLDRDAIARAAAETGAIVVAEEHLVDGGLGVRVAQVVAETSPCPMEFVGIQETVRRIRPARRAAGEVRPGGAGCRGGRAQSRRAQASSVERPPVRRRCQTPRSPKRFSTRARRVTGSSTATGVFQRIYGDPSPLFGKPAAELLGRRLRRAARSPSSAAAWKDRFARALDGETAASARAPRRRHLEHLRVSRSASRARFGTPAPWRARSRAWSTAEQELRHTVLGALKAHGVRAQRRCRRFLHDSVGQNLTALGLQLDLMRMDLETVSPDICRRIGEIQKLLEEMMEEVREYSYELNPSTVERAGLRPALDRLVGRIRERFAGTLRLNVDPSLKLDPKVASRDVPDRAGGRGERRATFQLLHDRNRGKVHTYWHVSGSAG